MAQLFQGEIVTLSRPQFFQRAADKRRPAGEQIPKRHAQRVDVRTRVDCRLTGAGKLLRAGKGWRADESGLGLIDAEFSLQTRHLRDAVVDHLYEHRAARLGFDHQVRRLDVAVDDAVRFRGREGARGLLHHFERQRERQRPFAADPRFERFALDQLHDVKAFAILLSVMRDARDVRMMQLRGGTRFAQESCPRGRIRRHACSRLP